MRRLNESLYVDVEKADPSVHILNQKRSCHQTRTRVFLLVLFKSHFWLFVLAGQERVSEASLQKPDEEQSAHGHVFFLAFSF